MPSEMLKLTDGNSPLYHPAGICVGLLNSTIKLSIPLLQTLVPLSVVQVCYTASLP